MAIERVRGVGKILNLGKGKTARPRPNLPEPIEPHSHVVPSRVAQINEARAAESGFNAAAELRRSGSPGSESNAQVLSRAIVKAGFGENFVERFRRDAREFLIKKESTRIGGDPKNVTDEAVNAQAHEMARAKADSHNEPQMRSLLRDLADTGFNYQAGTKLVKGIQKVEPEQVRKGLLGNPVVDVETKEGKKKKEGELRRAQLIAAENRPARIAEQGVDGAAMKNNIAELESLKVQIENALKLGDIQLAEEIKKKYYSALTDFESRMAAGGIMSGDYSPAATERTATNITGENAEERIRGAKGKRYPGEIDTKDKGSENEGLKNIPGTISTEPAETASRGWDVIASDPELYNEYLKKFSSADVRAINKAWSKYKGVARKDKSGRDYSPIEQMRRGEILAKFAKSLSIEALGKHGEITARGSGKGVVRGPEEAAIAEERAQNVRQAMKLIDSIIAGKRSYAGLNKYETLRETGKDIRSIVDSLKDSTGTKKQQRISEAGALKMVRKAIDSAAAGNPYQLSNLRMQMAAIIERGQLPEQQIAKSVGSAPQVGAIIGDIGTRIRGGASTIAMRPFRDVTTGRMRKGVGPAKIPAGVEPVRTGGVEGDAFTDFRREFNERGGSTLGEPAPIQKKPVAGSARRQEGIALREEAQRKLDAARPAEREETPAPKKEFKDLPKASELHQAVLEFKKSLNSADVNYGDGGTKSNLMMSRIDRLTRDYKKEMRKNKPIRAPRQISNVRELSRAQAELDKLRSEIELNKKKLDEVRRVTSDFKSSFTSSGDSERKTLLFGPGSHVESGDGYSTSVPETFGMYMDALTGRIKVLQGSVTDYEKALEKAYSTGKLKPGVTRALLREGERAEISPRMMDISRLKKKLDDPNLSPRERNQIEGILRGIRVEEGGFRNPKAKKPGAIAPSAPPMSTAFVPQRFESLADVREIVPGREMVGGRIPPKGRKKSKVRTDAARNKRYPEKKYGTRSSDISAIENVPDAVQRLIQGLPR